MAFGGNESCLNISLELAAQADVHGPGVCPEGGPLGLGLEVATETRTQRGDRLPGPKRASEGGHLGIPGAVADQVPSLCLGRLWVLIQLLWMDFLGIVPGGGDEDFEEDDNDYEHFFSTIELWKQKQIHHH